MIPHGEQQKLVQISPIEKNCQALSNNHCAFIGDHGALPFSGIKKGAVIPSLVVVAGGP